ARSELSHAVLTAGAFDSDRCHYAFLHFENLYLLFLPMVLAMARSAGRVANRTRRAQLFHDRILESGERDSPRTSSGHARERADDAYQRADCDRCEFGVGFCAGDFLFIALPFLRLVVLLRPLSRQLSAGADVSCAHNRRAVLFRNSVGKLRDGFQARRSVWNFSRHRFGAFLRRVLPDAANQSVRGIGRGQHLASAAANLWTGWDSARAHRGTKPPRCAAATDYAAHLSNCAAAVFALGVWSRRAEGEARREFDSVLGPGARAS